MPNGAPSLAAGDEVAFLPPVSGGQQATVSSDIILLVREPIQPREILLNLKAFEDAAAAQFFDGFVRNNFKGQRTLHLEYEAYEPMAYTKAARNCRAYTHSLRNPSPRDRAPPGPPGSR